MLIVKDGTIYEDWDKLLEVLPGEVALFSQQWGEGLNALTDHAEAVHITTRPYGYEVKYKVHKEPLKWFFLLELYYPLGGRMDEVAYLKIARFLTMPTRQGKGSQAFKLLLESSRAFGGLHGIRLLSIHHARGFWLKQGFKGQWETLSGWRDLDGDDELNCLYRPLKLSRDNFIYPLRSCGCDSCRTRPVSPDRARNFS